MKRTNLGLIIAASALLLLGAVDSPGFATAQDEGDAQATIAALQTEVADLRTQVATLTTPTVEATETNSTTDDDDTQESSISYLAGNALSELPEGQPGVLDVIEVGPYDGTSIPLVVRNNTDEAVTAVTVIGEARDSDGGILATGRDQGFRPYTLNPGDAAIGFVYFGLELPKDAELTFDSDSESPEEYSGIPTIDAELVEIKVTEESIVGSFRNPSDQEITSGIFITVHCFGPDGTVASVQHGRTEKTDIGAGDDAAFQILLYNRPCENYVIAGIGHP